MAVIVDAVIAGHQQQHRLQARGPHRRREAAGDLDLAVAGLDGGHIALDDAGEDLAHVQVAGDLVVAKGLFALEQHGVGILGVAQGDVRRHHAGADDLAQELLGLILIPEAALLLKAQLAELFFHEHALGLDVVADEVALVSGDDDGADAALAVTGDDIVAAGGDPGKVFGFGDVDGVPTLGLHVRAQISHLGLDLGAATSDAHVHDILFH